MITDAFLSLIYFFVFVITSPLRLLSDVSISPSFLTSINTAKGYIASIDPFLPLSNALIPVLGILITYETGYFGYKIIMWIVKRFPTQS